MHILNQNTFKMLIEQNWLNMRPGLGRSKLIEGLHHFFFILKMCWQSVLLGFVWKFLPSLFLSKVCDGLIDRFDQSLPCRKQFSKDFPPIISMINPNLIECLSECHCSVTLRGPLLHAYTCITDIFFFIGQMGLGTHTLSSTQENINLQQRRDYK